jgi:XTP/dITP diphosphohydrolase
MYSMENRACVRHAIRRAPATQMPVAGPIYLSRLKDQPRPWSAHFHCTVAVAVPQGGLYFHEGQVYGEIIPEERGTNGFGYDPIFLVPELNKTMAELSMAEKNLLSHRARAVRAALPTLISLFRSA